MSPHFLSVFFLLLRYPSMLVQFPLFFPCIFSAALLAVNAKSTLTLEGKAKADLKGAMASVKGDATTMVG